MTIATRLSKSWSIPKFDIKDPTLVLYLPLWYPYSDMAGSTIYSYDTNRHTGTVTGATWGSQGRDFDGSNDNVVITSISGQPTGNSAFTLVVWGKFDGLTGDRVLASFGVDSASPRAYGIYGSGNVIRAAFAGSNGIADTVTTLVTGQWYCAIAVYDTTANQMYLNGVLEATTSYSSADLYAGDFYIGEWVNGASDLDGSVGEVLLYNRALSAGEVKNIYRVTKWRYQ